MWDPLGNIPNPRDLKPKAYNPIKDPRPSGQAEKSQVLKHRQNEDAHRGLRLMRALEHVGMAAVE